MTQRVARGTLTSDAEVFALEVRTIPVDRELMKGSTPTLVLSILSRSPAHGYQMVRELDELSQGVLTFKEGTLYPILHHLEQEGFITSTWERQDGRDRKVYRVTQVGEAELRRRVDQWQDFTFAVDQVVRGGVPVSASQ